MTDNPILVFTDEYRLLSIDYLQDDWGYQVHYLYLPDWGPDKPVTGSTHVETLERAREIADTIERGSSAAI